ncbi:MAG: hypothetical protein IJQ84_03700 [Paludibacteraceae bacterium]|nr:hypothetical protein [Paludibacteraceae bacterium]
MKKIFTFIAALAATLSLSAKETVVWTGNEPISWNTEVYQGTQYETPANTFSSLKAGYIIKVSVVAMIDEPQYVMTYKAGEGWSWTDLNSTVANGVMSYTVESDQIGTEIAERNLIFRGQGYNITQIVVDDLKGDDPDPQPQPGGEYVDQTVWSGDVAISWNADEYPGEQLDTYNVQQDMLAGLAKDDSIKIYYAQAIEGAQFALTYKAGESWSWTDLTIAQHNGFFAYKVESDAIAQDIADHGLVIRGQGYHATSIVIGKPKSTTGFETTNASAIQSGSKLLRNGQLYILRDGKIFNALGQIIESF